MKSFCIKTDNEEVINYLLNKFNKVSFSDISYVKKEFKVYLNFIVHYKGEKIEDFYKILCEIITNTILDFYEENIVKGMLLFNYFYFDNFEIKTIANSCVKLLKEEHEKRKEFIYNAVFEYFIENKSMVLDGFVTFRLKDYLEEIDEAIDKGVNKYIVEKEYAEFIGLLKMYINSKEPETKEIHLIYTNGESVLLDENKDIITISSNSFNTKYLSDITFSSNDFTLNALLSLLPKKITVHLITVEDEFINTIKLIFENRVYICSECNICRTYKMINSAK